MTFQQHIQALSRLILQQSSAALFAILILTAIILSKLLWQPDWVLARYDALVIFVLILQILLIKFKLETWDEAKVIIIFHVTGTIMEIFKTKMGSWHYPEASLLRIGGVPLFTGFMYAAIGSFMARNMRLLEIEYQHMPSPLLLISLSLAIYINFFIQHYIYDFRWILLAVIFITFKRTWIFFTYGRTRKKIPILGAFLLLAFALWIAENIGTISGTWTYKLNSFISDNLWHLEIVSMQKIISWFLLIQLSFVLVYLVHRRKPY